MPDPVIEDEVKVQTDMIADVLEGFIPPSTTTQPEVPTDGEEGKERQAEEAVEQVETPVVTGKEEAKVVETPVAPVAPEPVTPVAAPVVPEVSAKTQEQTEVEILRQQLAEMREAMEKMAAGPTPVPAPTPAPAAQAQAQPTVDQQMNLKQILRFLPNDETYDQVTKNAENFNILLTNVVNTAVQRSLQMLPQVATVWWTHR